MRGFRSLLQNLLRKNHRSRRRFPADVIENYSPRDGSSMLSDKDRIFTNLYGFESWELSAARRRGIWDKTVTLAAKGQAAVVEEIKNSGLRGRGGAGFP